MKFDTNCLGENISKTNLRGCKLVALCLILILLDISSSYSSIFKPPNLNNCTHLEIQYPRGTIDYFVPTYQDILSKEEKEYIQSFKKFVIKDKKIIKAFAHDVNSGTFHGVLPKGSSSLHAAPIQISCYRDSKMIESFTVYDETILTKNNIIFEYARGLPNIKIIEPPEMLPFKYRFLCALNMKRLYVIGFWRSKGVGLYPEPDQWCDTIVSTLRNIYLTGKDGIKVRRYKEEDIYRLFTCPSVNERINQNKSYFEPNEPNLPKRSLRTDEPNSPKKSLHLLQSHYAMNPKREPNSPGDMVLLFETKAGWNQYGGPELFTFDNHDPKGGCVLLNDGKVKFIRTEDELHALRWK